MFELAVSLGLCRQTWRWQCSPSDEELPSQAPLLGDARSKPPWAKTLFSSQAFPPPPIPCGSQNGNFAGLRFFSRLKIMRWVWGDELNSRRGGDVELLKRSSNFLPLTSTQPR